MPGVDEVEASVHFTDCGPNPHNPKLPNPEPFRSPEIEVRKLLKAFVNAK